MSDVVRVRRALFSVSDKTGVVELARALVKQGAEIISTGGTAKALAAAGIPVVGIERVTNFPEMMDGRVKTLHPMVHGGLLSVRTNPEHVEAMRAHGIQPIDLVCINLYPFAQTIAKRGVSREEAIENIDIGGPSMVRSGAKNHEFVAVVTDPGQYAGVIEEIGRTGGTSLSTRTRLAGAAFAMTARYDTAIAAYMNAPSDGSWPEVWSGSGTLAESMRYGENPHQRAALYRDESSPGPSVVSAAKLHGKELGYNNVADAAAALELAAALTRHSGRVGACVIKHANPCGAAVAGSAFEAIDRAIAGDPVAAFGGIFALAGELDEPAAQRLCAKDVFAEVIVAEAFSPEALRTLQARWQNVRLLATGPVGAQPPGGSLMFRSIPGGVLVQERDLLAPDPRSWQHRAGPAPTDEQLACAAATEIIVRAMSSNAIAIGGIDGTALRLMGGGVGQVDRVTACRLAVEKAGERARGAVAVSDAFFPFPDGPKILIDAGVKMIVHPGGSKRDSETFEVCDQHAVCCLVTGVRRFRH